jgi:iron(III) transport system ATP-binding protein
VASVALRGLTKRYGAAAVGDDVTLHIEHGQLVCLLGPSGCGKTTTLRLIAGFVEPTMGEIAVGDRVVSSPSRTLPPEQRNMSMVFQSYALLMLVLTFTVVVLINSNPGFGGIRLRNN